MYIKMGEEINITVEMFICFINILYNKVYLSGTIITDIRLIWD